MNRKKLLILAACLVLILGTIGYFVFSKPKTPVEYGVELLKNGGFEAIDEEGFPENWLPEAYFNYADVTRFEVVDGESGKCIQITNRSPNDARYFQTVRVSPDTTYLFSGLIKAEAEGGRGANLSVADVYAFSEAIYQTDGDWQKVEFYGKTGRHQHDVTLFARLGGYSGESTGTASFDGLSLVAVEKAPEGVIVQSWERQESSGGNDGEAVLGNSKAPLLLFVYTLAVFLAVFLARWAQALESLEKDKVKENRANLFLLVLLLAALLTRLYVILAHSGFPVDVSAFRAWANDMAAHGPSRFYLLPGHRDYPPGYMLVLWPLGMIGKLTGAGATELMIKLPSLLCDLGIIVLLYKVALQYVNRYAALLLSALYAFNPLTYLAGSAWGQVDSLPSLLLLIAVLFIQIRRWRYALPVYVLAVLMKPQALMAGPLGLLALIMDFVWNREQKPLKDVLYGVMLSLLTAAAIVLPFFNHDNGFSWLIGLYGNTMSYYNYATVNATNLFFLFGQNWVGIENAAPDALRLTGTLVILLPSISYLYINNSKLLAKDKTEPLLLSAASLVSFFSLLPVSLKTAGILYMVSVFILVAAMYLKGRSHKNLPLLAGIMLTGFSVMGTMMHERYLFLAIALFTLAYVQKRDVRILFMLIAVTGLCFLNTGVALDRGIRIGGSSGNLDAPQAGLVSDSAWLEYALSALSILLTSVSLYFGFCLSEKDAKTLPLKLRINIKALQDKKRFAFARPVKQVRFDRKDAILILLVTGLYAILALVNLGAVTAPQTPWVSKPAWEEGERAEAVLDLGEEKVFKLLFYAGVHYQDSTFDVEISSDGENYKVYPFQVKEGDLFNWRYLSHHYENAKGEREFDNLPRELFGRYVRISGITNQLTLMEVIAQDYATGENLPFVSASAGAERLIDEQTAFSGTPSWFNSMYFDEIYHARTAYEQRNAILGIEPNVIYETSHPPLGKLLMTFSVFIFGMTPFGWRFAGAMAGVLMLPGIYLLGKQLTKKRWLGLLAAALFALDFMHFTQTRIATIDSFATLFIIYAYFFMLRYMSLDFVRSAFKQQLTPLFLSGLMMGLAIASKWTGMYAGAGLAMLFFKTLYTNFVRSFAVRKAENQDLLEQTEDKDLIRRFGEKWPHQALMTCLWCLLFFVLIPAGIYYLSYIPVYMATPGGLTLEKVVRNNISMFNYHSKPGFGADHPWASPWHSWPIIKKPMYFYSGGVKNGTASVIWTFGNPLVWWGGLAALIMTFIVAGRGFIRVERMVEKAADISEEDFVYDRRPIFLVIAFLAQYAPWILVPRGTYIYHYFPSVPFIILCMVLMVDYLYKSRLKAAKALSVSLVALAAILFVAFFPYISGVRVSTAWLDAVRFIPNWLYY